MAVGCSHGDLIDHNASAAVLAFKDKYKPHTTVHLGDFLDTAAFRSGAKGTEDESRDIAPDFNAGLTFIKKLRPQIILNGNHEARLWRLADHHNAIVSECAQGLIERIRTAAAICKAEYVEDWSIRAYRTLGNYKLMHGYMYGENACRDQIGRAHV